MTEESKKSQKSGSGDSVSIEKTTSISESSDGSGAVRVKSLLADGGFHPNTQVEIPKAGEVFEVSRSQADGLKACRLCEEIKGE